MPNILIVCLIGCTSFDYLTKVIEEFPKAKECGKCHIDIHKEWLDSDHSKSYVNSHYMQMTDNYSFEQCLSCHIPQPRFSAETPMVRSMYRDEGVTCVSCHLEQEELCGPIKPTGLVKPHPIGVRPEVYRDSKICGRCHEATLSQWNSVTDDKKTCQECHMSSVVRKMTQSSGGFSDIIVSIEHETQQRRHLFAIKTLESIEKMLEIKTNYVDSEMVVTLINQVPHSLPTGDYGFRVLVLELFAQDDQGTEHSILREELAPEMKTHIPAYGKWERKIAVPSGSESLHICLRRISYKDQPELELINRIIELGVNDADG